MLQNSGAIRASGLSEQQFIQAKSPDSAQNVGASDTVESLSPGIVDA
jgi:hypothetical protein